MKLPLVHSIILSAFSAFLEEKTFVDEPKLAIVGGYVRDMLLGLESDDLDLTLEIHKIKESELDSSGKDEISTINFFIDSFIKWVSEHPEFGIISIKNSEQKSDVTKGKNIDTNKANFNVLQLERMEVDILKSIGTKIKDMGDLEEDAFRRDLTINALFLQVTSDVNLKLLDYVGGKDDMDKKILKPPLKKKYVWFRRNCIRII